MANRQYGSVVAGFLPAVLGVALACLLGATQADEVMGNEPTLRHIEAGLGRSDGASTHALMCAKEMPSCRGGSCCFTDENMDEIHERIMYLYFVAGRCVATGGTFHLSSKCTGIYDTTPPSLPSHGYLGVWTDKHCWDQNARACCPFYKKTMDVMNRVQCDAQQWVDELQLAIKELAHSGIVGVSGPPYGALLPTLFQAAPSQHFKVLLPFVDTRLWAGAEASGGHTTLVCKGPMGSTPRITDLPVCAGLAVEAGHTGPGGVRVTLQDVFVLANSVGEADLEHAVENFQWNYVHKFLSEVLGEHRKTNAGDTITRMSDIYKEVDYRLHTVDRHMVKVGRRHTPKQEVEALVSAWLD